MQLGPKNALNATDPWTAGSFARRRPTLSAAGWRRAIWAAALAATAAAMIRAPINDLIGGSAPASPTAGHVLGPAAAASLPLSAQAQIAGKLAADQPLLQAAAVAGGFAMANPAQRLSARFDRHGAWMLAGGHDGLNVHMSLRGLSGSGTVRAARVAPSTHANVVSYVRPTLHEWYRNGPLRARAGIRD